MNGLIVEQDKNNNTICIIEDFSDDLKELIRKNLSSVCHGVSRGKSGKNIYAYKNTLAEFIKRYQHKTDKTKKGMIGELLAHVLLTDNFSCFKTGSPLFNMEESSIKKGFDILLLNINDKTVYITEVKSGHANSDSSEKKNTQLLHTAKTDLNCRFNENNQTIWHNAINSVAIALESNQNLKDIITTTLGNYLSDAQKANSNSSSKNVVLVSVLYNTIADKIILKSIEDFKRGLDTEKIFNQSIIFSIQKETVSKVEQFLTAEKNNE